MSRLIELVKEGGEEKISLKLFLPLTQKTKGVLL
jgi:hypothetical protein